MSRTIREYKGKQYPEKSRRKIKKTKFFGWPDEKWAKGNGKDGYKRSYGHFCGMAPNYPKHILKSKKRPEPSL